MQKRNTEVAIDGDKWLINGKPTYEGREYNGWKIEGLLLNSRMIQAVFDDENEITRPLFKYPDTGKWDPDRNTSEFVAAMPEWTKRGLSGITVGLQGGNPLESLRTANREILATVGIDADDSVIFSHPWDNSAFDPNGNLKKRYLDRLKRVLDRSDELGLAVILSLFYCGQDQRLKDEAAIRKAVEEACGWVLEQGYTNVVIEIANEYDIPYYEHEIIRPHRISELINLAKEMTQNGRRLLVGASYLGGIPNDDVVGVSDLALLHGNWLKSPPMIRRAVEMTRRLPSYRTMPVLYNEDVFYDFELPDNNFLGAVSSYAGWGFLDSKPGFQRIPTNWRINTPLQRGFFDLLAKVTGSK
jgi:hypothetical protein